MFGSGACRLVSVYSITLVFVMEADLLLEIDSIVTPSRENAHAVFSCPSTSPSGHLQCPFPEDHAGGCAEASPQQGPRWSAT